MTGCCTGTCAEMQDVMMLDACPAERETLTSANKNDGYWERPCWNQQRMVAAPQAHSSQSAHCAAMAAHSAAIAAHSAAHQQRLNALSDAVSALQVAVEGLRQASCVRCGTYPAT
jgi:hypothetical protein